MGVLLPLALAAAVSVASGQPAATIPALGKLVGAPSAIDPSVAVFKGIPYARSPEGPLRWQPPKAHPAWAPKTLNATQFGAMCTQSGYGAPKAGTAENCLFLNVQTPAAALQAVSRGGESVAKLLPVMLWIHGGGYNTGASNGYAGDNIVHQSGGSVVVVTINYRLNIFGFLGGKEIAASTAGGGSGNSGTADGHACGAQPLTVCLRHLRHFTAFAVFLLYFYSIVRRCAGLRTFSANQF